MSPNAESSVCLDKAETTELKRPEGLTIMD